MNASEIYKIRWLPCENAFNQAIPPFSLVAPVQLDSSGNFTVSQPTTDNQVCGVTNGFQIAPSDPQAPGHGALTFDFPSWVAYDNTQGDPNIGDTWGAKANSWLLTKGKTGFVVVGVDTTNVRAMVVPCCGSGGGGNIVFIRINNATPIGTVFDGRLVNFTVTPPNTILHSDGAPVWFYDPNLPSALPELMSPAYFLGQLMPGGTYTINGQTNPTRSVYMRDDFNLALKDTYSNARVNQIQMIEFDSTGSSISDDWMLSGGDAPRSEKVALNGLTQNLSFYKYTCASGNLTQYVATGRFEHGLLKQWVDYA